MSDANWTGRTARTMSEAFGPYAKLTVRDSKYNKETIDAVIGWFCAGAIVVVITLLTLERMQ